MAVAHAQLSFGFEPLGEVVNVASVPKRSPFRYPGGKTWLVPVIRKWLSLMPKRPALLVEPFAGGATVGLTAAFEELADRVLLGEIDIDVASVWSVITAGKAKQLAERIIGFELTTGSVAHCLGLRPRTLIDRAFQTLLRNRVQHGGILAPGASVMKAGENGKGISSRWYPQTIAKRLLAIDEIRDRIGFVRSDAFQVIQAYSDASNCTFFIDPPYTVAGRRLYKHSALDHSALFRAAAAIKGTVMLTYDDTPEVRRFADENGFEARRVAMKSRQHAMKYELVIGKSLSWLSDD